MDNLFTDKPWLRDLEYAAGLYLPPRKVLRQEKYLIPGVVAGGAGGAAANNISVLQPQAIQSGASSVSTFQGAAMGSALTNGSIIVVGIWAYGANSGETVTSVTDTAGNTYAAKQTLTNFGGGSKQFLEIWTAANSTSTANNKITVNFSHNAYPNFGVLELSGCTNTLDGAGSTDLNGGSTAPAPGPFTTTNAFDILLIAMTNADSSATATVTTPGGYTSIAKQTNGAATIVGDFAYKIVSTTQSAINPTWTTGNFAWGAMAIALKST